MCIHWGKQIVTSGLSNSVRNKDVSTNVIRNIDLILACGVRQMGGVEVLFSDDDILIFVPSVNVQCSRYTIFDFNTQILM